MKGRVAFACIGTIGFVVSCQAKSVAPVSDRRSSSAPVTIGSRVPAADRALALNSAPQNGVTSAAPSGGPTPCEVSYEQTKAALAGAPSESDDQVPVPRLVARDVFLRDCQRMPEQVQRCQVFQYAMANMPLCQAARAAYDAQQAREAHAGQRTGQ